MDDLRGVQGVWDQKMSKISKWFLDASSHLYKRVCPSVGPTVRPLVRPSVHTAFVKIAENGVMQDGDASYVVYTALFGHFLV